MAGLQFSTAVRNGRLDSIETVISTTPTLEIFDGDEPANCAAADAGVKLVSAALPSDWAAAASGGVKAKSGTWQDVSADASGLAKHGRIKDTAGPTCHIQFLVSMAWVASTAVIVGQQLSNGGNVYKVTTAGTTHASTPPSGTGSGITNGTAVMDYVGPVGMVLDNVNIGVGQTVTINSFSITDGNA